MEGINLEKFRKLKHIEYIDEIVKEYAVGLKNIENTLRVRIFKDKNGKFYARKNFKIGTKPNDTPYESIEDNHLTIEDALNEAISTSMTSFICEEKDMNKQMIEYNKDWYSIIYLVNN